MTRIYDAPAVTTRGGVVQNTLGKGSESTEINFLRVAGGAHLSFGL
jgi:hypothetical protein